MTVTTHYGDENPYNLKEGEVSSGTTIVALPFDGGVVMGADSRVSTGTYVANRTSDKLAALSQHIYCARSGSAADTQTLTEYVRYFLQSLELETGRPVRVKTAAHMMKNMIYRNKDNLMAGVIVGGWDPVDGASIYSIAMGGACMKMPFAVGGSGSVFISGLLDSEYQESMTEEQALTLAKKAVSHAMSRDGSSGGCVRTVVLKPEGNLYAFQPGNQLPFGPVGY